MARPKDSFRAERLLEEAELEFSEKGFSAARLEDIARRAGIGRSSLLYHFASKQELYQATVAKSLTELGQELARAMTLQGDFKDRLAALVKGLEAFLQARPRLARLILRELVAGDGPGRDIIMAYVAPLLDQVEAFTAAGQASQELSGLSLRAVLMQIASDIVLWSAAGSLQAPLWGPQRDSWAAASRLIFSSDQ